MKNLLKISFFALALSFIFVSCSKEEAVQTNNDLTSLQDGDIIPGKYIVVLAESNFKAVSSAKSYKQKQDLMKIEVSKLVARVNVMDNQISNVYTNSIFGFAANLSNSELANLKKDSRIERIEPDRMVILKKPVPVPDPDPVSSEEVPFGITRVNGGASGATGTAWVIDTGIDFDHPDLNVDVARSVTFVERTTSADDQNGHGTHCAGTIAAIDNEIGVVGVAAGATVVAVRVLDRRGSGAYSGVIAGVDYVGANGSNGDVANMSLGGPVYSLVDEAVYNASQASGVIFCLAAGNESDDANNHSPARVNGPNIVTISAMDINDEWAYFSNYGTAVDYCAPGVNIKSTWLKGDYNTISGTSMATPHAAGVLLLGAARTDGFVIGDPDGNSDPIIVH